MENVDKITATSYEGLSVVVVQLRDEADVDLSTTGSSAKVNAILANLPEDVKTPSLGKFSIDDLPIIRLGVTAKMGGTELYDWSNNGYNRTLLKFQALRRST